MISESDEDTLKMISESEVTFTVIVTLLVSFRNSFLSGIVTVTVV